jgi:hypothetical protein
LFLEDFDFFQEVFDHALLMAVDPTRQTKGNNLKKIHAVTSAMGGCRASFHHIVPYLPKTKPAKIYSTSNSCANFRTLRDCDKFDQHWRQNHVTRTDVDLLAKSGFNSIRLPMHYNLFRKHQGRQRPVQY